MKKSINSKSNKNSPKIDWSIHVVANGKTCLKCGEVANPFPQYICNAHTHGMAKYNHADFQMVIHMSAQIIGYVLNSFGLRVQAGERFKAGDMVDGIFLGYSVRLDEAEEDGRKVLRVIIPDSKNRFPDDSTCDYPYSMQTLPIING